MQLQPVDSSFVRAAGYDDGKIVILYRTGHWETFDGTPELFAEFLATESKGRFVHDRLKRRPDPKETPRALDTYAYDECCSRHIAKAIGSGQLAEVTSWQCPVCCVEWKATDSLLGRHWKPDPWIVRIR